MNETECFVLYPWPNTKLRFDLNHERQENAEDDNCSAASSGSLQVMEHPRPQHHTQDLSIFGRKDCNIIWDAAIKSKDIDQLLLFFEICSQEMVGRLRNTAPTCTDKVALLNFLFVIGVVKMMELSPGVDEPNEMNDDDVSADDFEEDAGNNTDDATDSDSDCEVDDDTSSKAPEESSPSSTKAEPEEAKESQEISKDSDIISMIQDNISVEKPNQGNGEVEDAETGQKTARKRTTCAKRKSQSGLKVECESCGKSLHPSNFTRHMRIHSGERPFHCKMCPKTLKTKSDLEYHTKTHTGERPFQCRECGMCFAAKGSAKRHLRIHTGEKPFLCEECGRAFTQKHNFKEHLRIHTGEKPFECDLCGKRCSRQKDLVHHKRTHTGEKPYICEKCGRGFTQTSKLAKHLRTHARQLLHGTSSRGGKRGRKRKAASMDIIDSLIQQANV